MIGRREFITLLGGAAVAWPLAALAQQRTSAIRRIGTIDDGPMWDHFRIASAATAAANG